VSRSKRLSHCRGTRRAVLVRRFGDVERQRRVLLDGQRGHHKRRLFLESADRVVRLLQDVDRRLPVGRRVELSVGHAVRVHVVQRPVRTHTVPLARTFRVVHEHADRHVFDVAGVFLVQFLGVPQRRVAGEKSRRIRRVLPSEYFELVFNRVRRNVQRALLRVLFRRIVFRRTADNIVSRIRHPSGYAVLCSVLSDANDLLCV